MNSDDVDQFRHGAGDDPDADRSFEDILADVDEALAEGRTPVLPSDELEDELRQRLQRGAACLQKLDRVWSRHRRKGSSATPLAAALDETLRDDATTQSMADLKLGRFEIVRELGRGGNGVVFLANDPKLGRSVALKVPHLEIMIHAGLRRRFFQESRAAAGLDHPNVVPVFDAGEIGPICYIASAYCRGQTLAQWLRAADGPIPFDDVGQLMVQLADAVAHAHERGVLHRDLKPSNVMLEPTARGPVPQAGTESAVDGTLETAAPQDTLSLSGLTPRVTDFGLAKLVDSDAETTGTGAVVGTPSYMSPEQAAGKLDDVTEAADIYALGAIMYELLVQRPPFVGESPLEILVQVRAAEPIAPEKLRPGMPRDLATICAKCLEKAPNRRYESASALANDLRLYLDGRPIHARPVGLLERAWRVCRRRPAVSALAAALLLLSALSFAAIYGQWRRAEDQAREAIAERKVANEQRQRAEKTLRLAIGSIDEFFVHASEDVLFDRPGSEAIRKELLEAAQRYYARFLRYNQDDPQLRLEIAHARMQMGDLQQRLGLITEGRTSTEVAFDGLSSYVKSYPRDDLARQLFSECELQLASYEQLESRYDRAHELLQSAVARLDALHTAHAADETTTFLLATAYKQLAEESLETGSYDAGLEHVAHAKRFQQQLVRQQPERWMYRQLLLNILITNGSLEYRCGFLDRALQTWTSAVNCFPDVPDSTSIRASLATAHTNLSIVFLNRNDGVRAKEHLESARTLLEKVVQDNPDAKTFLDKVASLSLNYGILLRKNGDADGARKSLDRAVSMYTELVEKKPTVTEYRFALGKAKLAMAYLEQREQHIERARTLLEEARRLWHQLWQAHPEVVDNQFQWAAATMVLGTSYSRAGAWDEALAYYPKAISAYREILARQPDDLRAASALGAALSDTAQTYLRRGEAAKGLPLCLEAIEHQRRSLLADGTNASARRMLSAHYSTLAGIYIDLGRPEEALRVRQEQRVLWKGNALLLLRVAHRCAGDAASIQNQAAPDVHAAFLTESLDTLDESVDAGFRESGFLKTNDVFQTLRDNQRFQGIIERIEELANAERD